MILGGTRNFRFSSFLVGLHYGMFPGMGFRIMVPTYDVRDLTR